MIWIYLLGSIYLAFLAYSAFRAKKVNAGNAQEILLAKSGLPATLLFLSFSATLFSTFTLMGIPDFFRNHGLGTWLFIGVTDVAMGFVVLWFGLRYKRILVQEKLKGMSSLLKAKYGNRFANFVYILAIFIFLAPYVAIQIKGVSQIATELAPTQIPYWVWSVSLLAVIFIYSWIGGLRAIMYSDVVQGLILLTVIYIIAYNLTSTIGGVSELFARLTIERSELLSTPGPKGLMTAQFLITSFLAILWMPITQPQLTSRIAAAKSEKSIPIMAIGIASFALAMLLPTIIIGMYGALVYPDLTAGQFLSQVLVHNQTPFIGALALIGLLAAAMSTADSQLFSLSSEYQLWRSKDENNLSQFKTRLLVLIFTLFCLLVSLVPQDELALLARVSFAGTALVGPMIILALVSKERISNLAPIIALISLFLFTIGTIGIIPNSYYGFRLDLILILFTGLSAIAQFFFKPQHQ